MGEEATYQVLPKFDEDASILLEDLESALCAPFMACFQ
jgi:hypothetical protein